jgi:hypothetical protein
MFAYGGDPRTGLELLSRWTYGELIEPARYYLCHRINKRLRGHASPVVLPFRNGDIQVVPDSLEAALFALLAIEVSGKRLPQLVCRGCGNMFTPSDPRQRYCARSCRNRRYYHSRQD